MDSSTSFGYDQNSIFFGNIDLLQNETTPFTGYPNDTIYAQDGDWMIQIGDFGDFSGILENSRDFSRILEKSRFPLGI